MSSLCSPSSVYPPHLLYIPPQTHAAEALRAVMLKGAGISEILYPDLLALAAFFAITLAAATLMLRREVG